LKILRVCCTLSRPRGRLARFGAGAIQSTHAGR
jgi:hypothetical protein